MRRAIALIMMFPALFVVGCTPSHPFKYVGQWEARRKLDPQPSADPVVMEQASRVILTIKEGGTFELSDAGLPHDGTFEVEGDHAVLTITGVNGQPMARQDETTQKRNKPIRITPLPDGTMRYYDPGGFDRTGLIMKPLTDEPMKGK